MKILDNTGLAYFWASLKTLLEGKQDKLTAGTGININNGEISSTVTGIPAPPSNNGTYLLKCVVSSGVATYSWESVTVGGSY